MDIGDTPFLKQENVTYSKVIKYWVDGYYEGTGRNKKWIPGHWDKKLVNPALDPGHVWESGKWKEVKK
jgi:hypothetical protein